MTQRDIVDELLQPNLQDLKDHLRLTDNSLDRMLLMYLKSAITQAEHTISRTLASSVVTINVRASGEETIQIDLPYGDDMTDVTIRRVTLDDANYTDYTLDGCCLTLPVSGVTGRIIVEYAVVVGQVEDDIRQAILLMAARHFNNPLDSVDSLPTASANLLAPYRTWRAR